MTNNILLLERFWPTLHLNSGLEYEEDCCGLLSVTACIQAEESVSIQAEESVRQ